MKFRRIFVVLFVLLAAALLAVSAFADQDGHDTWCNSDQYGCWVTGEDGGKCYIMFWSEESRAYFMGGHSKPGELVTEMPAEAAGGRVSTGKAPVSFRTWKDALRDLYYNHRELLESQGVNIEAGYKTDLESFEKQISGGKMTESQVMDLIDYWDESYK